QLLHGETVREVLVVERREPGTRLLPPGRVLAARVADEGGAQRLVEGGPVIDPVAEGLVHGDRVVEEALRGVSVRPAAGVLDRLRKIPVVEGEPGQDAVLEQLVDEATVEVDALRVDGAVGGLDARPAHREAVGVESEALHELNVVGHAVVVVDRDLGGVAAGDVPRRACEVIPDRVELAVFLGGALDLGGSGRGTPDESGRPCEAVRQSERHQPFTAPAMMPDTSMSPAKKNRMSSGIVASTAPHSTIV